MNFNFSTDQTYLGIIKVINRATSSFDTSCMIVNYVADSGHVSEYFFFSDITEDVQRFKFKMIPGQLVTFKIKELCDGFYRYEATVLNLFEYSTSFHIHTLSRPENTVLKKFCLAFHADSLKALAMDEIKKLNIEQVFINGNEDDKLINEIVNNAIVKVETWGRNKPGGDDTWAADLVTDFGKFNNDYNSYLRKNFNFTKELFYERGFCPYRRMLEEYLDSDEYKKDVVEADAQTVLLKHKLNDEYDYIEHKAAYTLEVVNRKKKVLQDVYVSINSGWEFIYKNVRFLNYYDRYLKNAHELIINLQNDLTN